MVRFSFHDEDGSLIPNVCGSNDLSDPIDAIEIKGPLDVQQNRYKVLTTMLNSSSERFNRIQVSEMSEESPEFLAFLVLVGNKTRNLELHNCQLNDNATACLMAALLQWDGIWELEIESSHDMTASQLRLLCEGIASSRSLETLKLDLESIRDDNREAGEALISGLRRNRSLTSLNIVASQFFEEDSFLPNLMKAAVLDAKVEELVIHVFRDGLNQELNLDVLEDVLCCEECDLSELRLYGVNLRAESESASNIETVSQNESVTDLVIHAGNFDYHVLMKTIRLFNSLQTLELSGTEITSLEVLDHLLLDESSTLEHLDVRENLVGAEEMKRFVSKLDKTKHLQSVKIGKNPWEDSGYNSVKEALVDSIQKSTSLERVDIDCADLYLALNRGGRRAFMPESSESVPISLWPRILQRASKEKYYNFSDGAGEPSITDLRVDVLFWMLKRMAPQL
mmetsp:Transcript_30117/g.72284  ORF Transcript_30117/g.72284 Transcript_30117/m.72284 type:complete len:453 (+) Transcript_30117:80-1438(+)